MGSQGSLALALVALTGCYSTVHRQGVVERRVLERHAPAALPVRSEPVVETWPSEDAPQVVSDIVVIDQAGGRKVHARSRAERHADTVLVDHGPGWPPNYSYPVAELQDVYVDHVVREPGPVARRELNAPVTVLAVIAAVAGAGLSIYVLYVLTPRDEDL